MRFLLAVASAFTLPAMAQEAIVLTIGDVSSNPGATVEVPVTLETADVAPEVITLFIAYDNTKLEAFADYYEFTSADLAGQPVRDENDNVIVRRSPARPEQVIADAGKVVETAVHVAQFPAGTGVLGINIAGLNTNPIANGLLLTLGFRVLPVAVANETLTVRGVDANDPVFIPEPGGNAQIPSFSSWSHHSYVPSSPGAALPMLINDGMILLGCAPLPAAPTSVTASQGNLDAVEISWTAADALGVEYRVFRSTGTIVDSAQPLGTAWQTGTSFTDITALAPEVTMNGGCNCEGTQTPVRYNYWVKARSAAGCESEFSTPPAEGFRGEAKSFGVAAAANAPANYGQWLLLTFVGAAFVLVRAIRHRAATARPALHSRSK